MPNNKNSQRGFVETVALLGIALMLLTLPLAQKLAKERQELRKFAAESKCPRSCNTERPGECYSWAGDGCDWQGPLQYPQGSCYCKRDREAVSQQQAQQQASSSQTTCDNANYSWCKDGIRYYCNENKSLTPISQKWQEGNSCYVCGAAAREPVLLSECSSDITNQCGGKNNGDSWCEGSTIVQCVRDPSGYLVKNITSTLCSSAQTTTTSEKPAIPAPAVPAPAAPAQPASTNKCYTNSKYDEDFYVGSILVCCTAGVEVACSTKSAPAAPAQPASTNKCYTNSKYDEDFYVGSTLVCCTAGVEVSCTKAAPAQPAPTVAVVAPTQRANPRREGEDSQATQKPQPTTNISEPAPTVTVVTPTQKASGKSETGGWAQPTQKPAAPDTPTIPPPAIPIREQVENEICRSGLGFFPINFFCLLFGFRY